MIQYDLLTEWFFEAPIEKVWGELVNFRSWPEWWHEWKQLDVHGDEVKVGTLIDCAVRSKLPYTLRYQLEITLLEPPFRNEHATTGSLVGNGRWVLEERNGGTAVNHEWQVGTTNPVLNFFGRFSFAKSMMNKNHVEMMNSGYEGLKARLAAGME